MTTNIDADAVADYLETHPSFFDAYPEVIAGLKLTTALGGRTVSLQERQVEVLREKVRQMELKLANQGHVARDNESIMDKFHHWIVRLLASGGGVQPELLLQALRECFDVPAASLRLWHASADAAAQWTGGADLDEAKALANQQITPYCGAPSGKAGVSWLDDAPTMQSVALVALRKQGAADSFGLLVLGSPDPKRFSASLATDILQRIGETASAALHG